MSTVLRAHIVDGQQIGMVQCAQNSRLVLKPLQAVGITSERGGQNLERDRALQPHVASAIHFSHTTRADPREDFIRPEFGTRGEDHPCAIIVPKYAALTLTRNDRVRSARLAEETVGVPQKYAVLCRSARLI